MTLCIPLAARTNAEFFALIDRAEKEAADLYEFRFDALEEPPRVEALVAAASRPVLATCRSLAEGGNFRGGHAERRRALRRAGEAGAAFIDCEVGDLAELADAGAAVRMASFHDFDSTPTDLDRRVAALEASPAEWVKFAVTAVGVADAIRVFEALAKRSKPAVGIAMGGLGVATRVLGPRFGSRIVFGSLGAGLESAPGQPTAGELVNLYRIRTITERTEINAFLGDRDAPVPGHAAYNLGFIETGADAVCIPFFTGDAREFLDVMPGFLHMRFVALDARHSAAALAWADDATARARRTGTANILVRQNGVWVADSAEQPREAIT